MSDDSIRDTVNSVFKQVARDQGRTLAPLSDDLRLIDCGLDSLSFALVVATLEDSLEIDPFNTAEKMDFPITFGDFITLYVKAAR